MPAAARARWGPQREGVISAFCLQLPLGSASKIKTLGGGAVT